MGTVSGPYYSYAQLEGLWIQYGGDPSKAAVAAAIAEAESAGGANSVNYNTDGSTDRGLWQINTVHGSQSSFDIATNVKAAIDISNNGQDFNPWTTYQSGAYMSHMQSVSPAATGSSGSGSSDSGSSGVGSITTSGSSSTSNDPSISPYTGPAAVTPGLDMATLEQDYGIAAAVVNSDSELKDLFTQAVAQQWSTAAFAAKLQNTNWFKTHSESQRQSILLQFTDPATYSQQMAQSVLHVRDTASSMGGTLSNDQVNQLAQISLQSGWDAEQLSNAIAGHISYSSSGHLGGDAGKLEMSLRGLAANNGVDFSQGWYLDAAKAVGSGNSSQEYYEGLIRQQAANTYKAYAKQINAGMDLKDIAAPYINDMSKILEVNTPTMMDPTIRKALQFSQNGQITQQPLWHFDDMLRQDPRWEQTNNARDDMYSVAHKVLTDFGFQT